MTGTCKDCALAKWETTPTGRLGRRGACLWRPAAMPVALWADGIERAIAAERRRPFPTIWRDEDRPCDVFEPAVVPA